MLKKAEKGDHCLNCNQELQGENFCPNCGQKNDTRRLSFWDMLAESFTNIFALDSKIFNSLKPLFFKPGKLTKEYVSGKRTKYIHPIRLYLGASILFFTIYSLSFDAPNIVHTNVEEGTEGPGVRIAEVKDTNSTEYKIIELIESGADLSTEEALDSVGLENTVGNRWTYFIIHKTYSMDSADKKNQFSEYFRSKIPIFIFVFLPVFALALRLVYVRRDFYYLEHLVFSLHNLAALFLVWALILPTGLIAGYRDIFTITMFLLFGAYVLIGMKKFYNQAWGKTVLKFIIINLVGLFISIFFLVLGLMIVLITY